MSATVVQGAMTAPRVGNNGPDGIDCGHPVEWMVDPDAPAHVLGVVYEFSKSGQRKTVWYTANKRRAKRFIVVRCLEGE